MSNAALRPLTTSELLDRTFALYRGNFVLFAGIASLPAILAFLMHLAGTVTRITMWVPGRSPLQTQWMFLGYEFLVLFIASIIGGSIATAATTVAVYRVNLGQPATITNSYRKLAGSWFRVIVASIWVFLLVTVILAVTFAGLALLLFSPIASIGESGTVNPMIPVIAVTLILLLVSLFWLYLSARFAFIVPALVLDQTSIWGAFRRSKFLAKGSKGRIFLLLLLTVLLTLAFTWVLRTPGLMFLNARRHAVWLQFSSHLARFLSALIAGPVATIAVALIYIDQKVRKEAFDLQVMMDAIQESGTQALEHPPVNNQTASAP